MQIVRNLYEIRAKFVQNSCEFCPKFVTTTFTAHFGDEFRTKFVRISCHFCKTLAEEPHQHHLCNNEVPTPRHISPYVPPPPPRHTHTHTNTHTHTDTHTHPCTNTHMHTLNESKQPPTRPTPTHCPPTHPHTYLDSGCVTVGCLGGGGVLSLCVCVCVCMCVSLCVWMGFCGCVCVCVCVCVCLVGRCVCV